MQQGDLLMQRKLNQMVDRQQKHHERHLSTFSFTEQFVKNPVDPNPNALPDNWENEGQNDATGQYFSEERVRQPTVSVSTTNKGSRSKGNQPRPTPAERQAELQTMVKDRVLMALDEQKEEDAARIARCQVQREVERLKLHQRTRARVELQSSAGQTVADGCASKMDLQDTRGHGQTASAQLKATVRDEPQIHYVAHNRDRMERNMRHREYCLETMKERAAVRREMEEQVGTEYTKTRNKLLGTMGVQNTAKAATLPTADDLHLTRVQTAKERAREEEATSNLAAEKKEMSELDNFLWDERRKTKGSKAPRVRELPFSLSAPYHRDSKVDTAAPPSIKLPNLGTWKKRNPNSEATEK